jgi:ATP-dependent DNA ligase
VVAAGGEGLMLHGGDAPYSAGRSDDLLKLKRFNDAEARVVAHNPGKGRLQGMLDSLTVETPDGTRFRVGTGFTDAQRRHPPPIGSTITYRYQGVTRNGKPRFPVFWRVRADEPVGDQRRDYGARCAIPPGSSRCGNEEIAAASVAPSGLPTSANPLRRISSETYGDRSSGRP